MGSDSLDSTTIAPRGLCALRSELVDYSSRTPKNIDQCSFISLKYSISCTCCLSFSCWTPTEVNPWILSPLPLSNTSFKYYEDTWALPQAHKGAFAIYLAALLVGNVDCVQQHPGAVSILPSVLFRPRSCNFARWEHYLVISRWHLGQILCSRPLLAVACKLSPMFPVTVFLSFSTFFYKNRSRCSRHLVRNPSPKALCEIY